MFSYQGAGYVLDCNPNMCDSTCQPVTTSCQWMHSTQQLSWVAQLRPVKWQSFPFLNAGIYSPLPMQSTTSSVCWEFHLGDGGGPFFTAPRQPVCVSPFLPTAWQVDVRPRGDGYIRSLAQLQVSLPHIILWRSSHENEHGVVPPVPRCTVGNLLSYLHLYLHYHMDIYPELIYKRQQSLLQSC